MEGQWPTGSSAAGLTTTVDSPVAKSISYSLMILVVASLVAAGSVAGGLVILFQVRAQSVTNQLHFDCAVSVFAETEPPKCAGVIEQFRNEGIFPPRVTGTP